MANERLHQKYCENSYSPVVIGSIHEKENNITM